VRLPRPRGYAMLATPEFGELRRLVLDIIHEDSVLAFEHIEDRAASAGR
jgi:hypothetical protein